MGQSMSSVNNSRTIPTGTATSATARAIGASITAPVNLTPIPRAELFRNSLATIARA